jgi:hypothetical protein
MLTTCPRCAMPRQESYQICPSCGFDYSVAPAISTCPRCQTPRAGSMPICPGCGYDYRTATGTLGPSAPAPTAASKPDRRPLLLLATVLLVAIAALGGYYFVQAHSTHTVTGEITLSVTDLSSIISGGSIESPGPCRGDGGYSDLGPGAPVVLKDENGTILASSILSSGTGNLVRCTFTFSLEGVPDSAKFYVITVSHRGDISESHDQLAADDWHFSLTIGR